MSSLISCFPNYSTSDSLFQKMVTWGAPWDSVVAQSMDMAYFTMYSGIKTATQFVFLNSNNGVANVSAISKILWDIYGLNWKKLWDAMNSEYNPINNYDVDETVETERNSDRNIVRSDSSSGTVDETQKQTNSENGTENVVSKENSTNTLAHGHLVTKDVTADNYNYGFNSTEKVPVTSVIEHGTEPPS